MFHANVICVQHQMMIQSKATSNFSQNIADEAICGSEGALDTAIVEL
jgi:hypothetical protein